MIVADHPSGPSVNTLTITRTAGPYPSATSRANSESQQSAGQSSGKGIGISCSLVQSAAGTYNSAVASGASGGGGSSTAIRAYYAQALHMACLRSSPLCSIPECTEVEAARKITPDACKEGDEHRGGEFEEDIFKRLVQATGFGDISGRQAKTDAAVAELTQQIESGNIGSPFLNLMMGIGAFGDGGTDTKALAQGYYSTIQVFSDLQPLFESYIKEKIGGDGGSGLNSLEGIIDSLARSHSQLLKCGVAPSFSAQGVPSINSKTGTPNTSNNNENLTPAAAAAASFFIPLVAAQLRNDRIIQAVQSQSGTRDSSPSIADFANLLNAQLPVSPDLQFDISNWLFGPGPSTNPNSEAFSLLSQSVLKAELSNEAGSSFDLTTKLEGALDLSIPSRTNPDLSDFTAFMGLFFPTANGTHATKPIGITVAGKAYPIVGPAGVVFPAAGQLIPGFATAGNISTSGTTNNNVFAQAGGGGAITPIVPTNGDIQSLLYESAILKFLVNPVHYIHANPPITVPRDHLYILDLVSGKEIPSTYSGVVGKDSDGNDLEIGKLEATLAFGSGIWGGGWGGGGAFVVGVKDWVDAESGSAVVMVRWRSGTQEWGLKGVVGWVMGIVLLGLIVF